MTDNTEEHYVYAIQVLDEGEWKYLCTFENIPGKDCYITLEKDAPLLWLSSLNITRGIMEDTGADHARIVRCLIGKEEIVK